MSSSTVANGQTDRDNGSPNRLQMWRGVVRSVSSKIGSLLFREKGTQQANWPGLLPNFYGLIFMIRSLCNAD